jgi:hypothetical protein
MKKTSQKLSLRPLNFSEAVADILKIKPEPKHIQHKSPKHRAKKKTRTM